MMKTRSVVVMIMFLAISMRAQSPSGSQIRPPSETLREFCKMDAEGKQLRPDGWYELAAMFVHPRESPGEASVIVIKDFVVSDAKLTGNKAQLYVEYTELGIIDPSFRLEPPPFTRIMRDLYSLVLTDTQWVVKPGSLVASEVKGPLEWKIEDYQRIPHVSIEAAMRYVTELRDKTRDPLIKKNAIESLAKLKKLN
jgi:hypothetical protein